MTNEEVTRRFDELAADYDQLEAKIQRTRRWLDGSSRKEAELILSQLDAMNNERITLWKRIQLCTQDYTFNS